MGTFAYYRLPYSDSYVKIESEREPVTLREIEELGDYCGYAIVPFYASEECPIVVIRGEKVSRNVVPHGDFEVRGENGGNGDVNDRYRGVFEKFHEKVVSGEFRKIVLARKVDVEIEGRMTSEEYFFRACRMYPRLMVQLFSSEVTGTWLIASPEILLEKTGDLYHTVALAGTMPFSEGYATWSDKNRREQNVVERYIEDIIRRHADEVVKDGPISVRAGDLLHLRTDFRFKMNEGERIGEVIGELHPTPAVCGLPKKDTCEFIMENEGMGRRYYSGFAGPINVDGESHLYVSLRCAELKEWGAVLYAGGGIMAASECEMEWKETENKMRTIGVCFASEK